MKFASLGNFLAHVSVMAYNKRLPRNGVSILRFWVLVSILTTEERNEQTSVQNKSLILAQDERWRRA